jgi:hypothetical protein
MDFLKNNNSTILASYFDQNNLWPKLQNATVFVPTDQVLTFFAAQYNMTPQVLSKLPIFSDILMNHLGSMRSRKFNTHNGHTFSYDHMKVDVVPIINDTNPNIKIIGGVLLTFDQAEQLDMSFSRPQRDRNRRCQAT